MGHRWDGTNQALIFGAFSDKYLPQSIGKEFQKNHNSTTIQLKLLEGAGHMAQEDWYKLYLICIIACNFQVSKVSYLLVDFFLLS